MQAEISSKSGCAQISSCCVFIAKESLASGILSTNFRTFRHFAFQYRSELNTESQHSNCTITRGAPWSARFQFNPLRPYCWLLLGCALVFERLLLPAPCELSLSVLQDEVPVVLIASLAVPPVDPSRV